MAHRSQSSSLGDNPLDPNFLPPHYREEYRIAIDKLIENDIQGYLEFLQTADVPSFLAQPEIQHIKGTSQGPSHSSSVTDLTYHDKGFEGEGSSDTYWPMQSDLAAPGLDLGWPLQQHSFIGPTEVTTLVNPSDPDMPSIKEQARRLIKNAHQVIAVVMDIFTDIDIFGDLLDAAARHVPVYILLDEQEAPHFVSMVNNCKVNLEFLPMMRVRTVAGITYYSRTGKTFKGQVKDRFLLVDCRAVLSGNYSFMWSYEKIHRSIAHLFLGELVTTFDEEFRILFAQSEPLVMDSTSDALAISDGGSTGNYLGNQFGLKRAQSLRNPIGYRRPPELPPFPYGDIDRNLAIPFRRNDPFRHTIEPSAGITIGKYSQQQFRLQQSYLEQGRSIISRQMEMGTTVFKRHSYAEGTQENYTSSRQFMKHRVMNNLEELELHREQNVSSQFYSDGPGTGSDQGHYNRLRGRPPPLAIDQHSESSFRSDLEPQPGNYGQDYFSSEDLGGPDGDNAPPLAGRYEGNSSNKRPTIGHAYACQSSPTHLHSPEKKQYPNQSDQDKDQDPDVRQGMRSWRINSYLSTYEDGGEEGINQPMVPDAFEDPQQPMTTDTSGPQFGFKEPLSVPTRLEIQRPRYGKPILPESTKDAVKTTKDLFPSASELKPYTFERGIDRGPTKEMRSDMEVKEAPELLLSKHESFRTRINPLLQRSSRLRSSLIFSSSKAEMHAGSLGLTPATEQDEELDTVRTSSIVAQILEKRRNREPFEWRKKVDEKETDREMESKEKPFKTTETAYKNPVQMTQEKKDEPHQPVEEASTVETETTIDGLKPQQTSLLNMNDPASRLQYFNELAAKRKASKMCTDSSLKASEPDENKPEIVERPLHSTTALTTPSPSVASTEAEPKKLDISSRLAELTRRPSFSSSKPPIISGKPPSYLKHTDTPQASSEGQKKDIFKSLKPLPSPKIFKRDPLKLKGLNPRRISAGEEIMTTDATDAEKSELKKIRSHSSTTLPRDESKDGLKKFMGSTTSINTLGEGKSEGKPLDFLKKQTQRLKGILGPKDKDKKAFDDRNKTTIPEISDPGKKLSPDSSLSNNASAATTATDRTTSTNKSSASLTGPSRYQPPGISVLSSSNLRDDTKVILEQISANSQKNRQERGEESGGDSDSADKGLERQSSIRRNRFLRPHSNNLEREGLLKRIESMRKEKKVYSRFEMGNSLG
ncbi:protein FAM83H [Eucyclogobius newberryi]|uniref:protein FAM83H n=1 Tax=Eucyclogobius newberryi TaxID=166745 RepID=UPI003B5C35D1